MDSAQHYAVRISRALRFIDDHLAEDIRISDLAGAASFSDFHFQRLFKAITGETPYDAILRLRLEKAVFLLRHHHHLRIADLAAQCGFPSPENFSRQFKQRFGFSPSAFRRNKELQKSRIYQEPQETDFYLAIQESRQVDSPDFNVDLEWREPTPVALIRAVFGADGTGLVEAYLELEAWANQVGLAYQGPNRRFGRSVDDPEVTPTGKYRYDFAFHLDQKVPLEGKIEKAELPGGWYATVAVQGDLTKVAQAWDHLYKVWLPHSGYLPRHLPALEEFIRGPEEIGWTTFDLKCRIPVEKL